MRMILQKISVSNVQDLVIPFLYQTKTILPNEEVDSFYMHGPDPADQYTLEVHVKEV